MNDSHSITRPDEPSPETIHAILEQRRRRFVVDVLAGRRTPIDLPVLARAITMRLPDDESADEMADRLDRMATTLHHVDLPKLRQAEVVEYDAEAGVVTPTGVERLQPFLDARDSLC